MSLTLRLGAADRPAIRLIAGVSSGLDDREELTVSDGVVAADLHLDQRAEVGELAGHRCLAVKRLR